MKQELDELLCQRYPKIFVNRHGDPKQTLMCWGFECGDGWYNIIKEKFGTLRFYTNGGNEQIYGMIRMAESMSAVTCEECGAPGKSRGRSWIYTACDAHAREEDTAQDQE